jgi:hypothetical protein
VELLVIVVLLVGLPLAETCSRYASSSSARANASGRLPGRAGSRGAASLPSGAPAS